MADLAELTMRIKSEGIREAARDLDKVEKEARETDRAVSKTDQTFRKTSKTARDLGGSLRGAAGTLSTLAGGFTAVAVARTAVQTVADFGFTMAQVRGITQDTTQSLEDQAEQYDRLEAAALQAGRTTRFTASEAAQAQLFLARAGFSASEIISALPGVLDLAAAGALDLGRAADIASNVLSQFGLNAAEIDRVGDVLVKVANSSNTDVGQLAEALKFAGASAGTFGISVETTAAALGTLGNAGIQASLAGTGLDALFRALIKPTTELRNEQERLTRELGLGSDAFDVTKADLTDIIDLLGRIDPQVLIRALGRAQAGRTGLVLTRLVTDLENLDEAARDSGGAAKELADIQNNTLLGSFRTLRSAIEGVFLETRSNEDAFKGLVDDLTGAVRILGGFSSAADEANADAQNLAAGIRTITLVFGILVGLKVASVLLNIASALRAVAAGTAAANGASLSNPYVLLAATVATATFAVYQFIEAQEESVRAARRAAREIAVLQLSQNDDRSIDRARAGIAAAREVGDVGRELAALRRVEDIISENLVNLVQGGDDVQSVESALLEKLFPSRASDIRREAEIRTAEVVGDIVAGIRKEGIESLDEALRDLSPELTGSDALLEAFGTAQRSLNLPQGNFGGGVSSSQRRVNRALGTNETAEGARDLEAAFRALNLDLTKASIEDVEAALRSALSAEIPRNSALELLKTGLTETQAEVEKTEKALQSLSGTSAGDLPKISTPTANQANAPGVDATGRIAAFKEELALQRELARLRDDEIGSTRVTLVNEAERLVRQLKLEGASRAEIIKLAEDQADALGRIATEQERAEGIRDTQKTLDDLKDENRLLQENLDANTDLNTERSVSQALREAEVALTKVGAEERERLLAAIEAEVREQARLTDVLQQKAEASALLRQQEREADEARKEGLDLTRDIIDSLEEEIELFGKSSAERRLVTERSELLAAAQAGEIENVEALTARYDELANKLRKLQAEQEASKNISEESIKGVQETLEDAFEPETFIRLAKDLGQAFGDFFGDVIKGAASLEEAFIGLVTNISNAVLDQLVENTISDLVTSLFGSSGGLFGSLGLTASAKGNIFSGGNVIPFARGGVIDGPMLFPLSSGIGLAGEAGPEAIIPLARDNNGNLGVRGGGATTVNQKTVINNNKFVFPNARNPGDFRKSRRHIAEDLNRIGG